MCVHNSGLQLRCKTTARGAHKEPFQLWPMPKVLDALGNGILRPIDHGGFIALHRYGGVCINGCYTYDYYYYYYYYYYVYQ